MIRLAIDAFVYALLAFGTMKLSIEYSHRFRTAWVNNKAKATLFLLLCIIYTFICIVNTVALTSTSLDLIGTWIPWVKLSTGENAQLMLSVIFVYLSYCQCKEDENNRK